MLGRFAYLMQLAGLVALSLGLACSAPGVDTDTEAMTGLQVVESSNALVRLVDLLDHRASASDPVDTAAARIDRIVAIAEALASRRVTRNCIRPERDPTQPRATIELAGCQVFSVEVDAKLEVTAANERDIDPQELTVSWQVDSFTIAGRELSGSYQRTLQQGVGLVGATMQVEAEIDLDRLTTRQRRRDIATAGVEADTDSMTRASVRFQHDHTIAREDSCVVIDGLAYAEGSAGRLTLAMNGVELCSEPCPRAGRVSLAASHLHRFHFDGSDMASHVLNEVPQGAWPLGCQ
jgi:hypothetical protein